MAKKKFRVAVAARTVDGREIKREYIKKAAELYDTDVYGARINLEHYRSVLPESPFKALGDVESIEFKEDVVGGEKRGVIYAELNPSEDLIAMNKAGQKVYTSIELQPDFPNVGDWYVVGIAVTDSPASMGTQRLSFSAAENAAGHLIGEYTETDFLFSESEDDESEETRPGIVERIKQTFAKFKKVTDGKNSELEEALEIMAQEFTALASDIPSSQEYSSLKSEFEALKNKFTTQENELKELSEAMEGLERFKRRPPATGGDGEEKVDY